MNSAIESDREKVGRCIAEVPKLRGILARGASQEYAMAKVKSFGAPRSR
jgi:hypothetical protein